MKAVERLLKRMRRQWMLEHFARAGAMVIAGAVNLGLLCWLLHVAIGLPMWSLWVVAGLLAAFVVVLAIGARARAPGLAELAKLADRRAGTEDLFSSAMEFDETPARFGWLGAQTVKQAVSDAENVVLEARWRLGRGRDWWTMGSVAAGLVVMTLTVGWLRGRKNDEGPQVATNRPAAHVVVAAKEREEPKPAEKPAPETQPVALPEPETQPEEKAPADATVKITNDMLDKYLEQMPGQEQVDLTGVTPIRWDQDEATGKNNPQDKNTEGEKIDPVKLDAALLKDLQVAKKTKDESGAGGKDGGVDIAVMGNNQGLKAKGDQGGKGNKESLSDAVSKDPRGEPSRMAVKPMVKALPIRSVEKLPTREKGEDRPMSPLDFAGALERMKNLPPEMASGAVTPLAKPEDHVVRQEGVSEHATELTESYFDLLRKADR